jgi:alcohol dehydrogenase class IV
VDRIREILEASSCTIQVYRGIPANPSTEDILAGLEKLKVFSPEVLIGLGGGSAIDASKLMGILYENPDYDFDRILREPLPSYRKNLTFIAIPSTSGTGTEVTKAAVATYREEDLKIGIFSDAFIADVAILDPVITLSMPSNVVAETGMDAMTHAVECYINKNLDTMTEILAKGAVEGLYKYLPLSYSSGDIESREKVHYYQSIAGIAFSNVGLGMAHGISHAFGGRYNLGHGLLNAIALPYVLEFNSRDPEVKERLEYLAKIIDKKSFIKAIRKLNKKLDIPMSFKEAGIPFHDFEENFEELVTNSLKGSTRKNPVPVTRIDMEKLLRRIYEGKSK